MGCRTELQCCKMRSRLLLACPAGVADLERATSALNFARKYELMSREALSNVKLVEVDYSDVEAFAGSLPKGGKLLVVDGDVVGGKAADERVSCWGWMLNGWGDGTRAQHQGFVDGLSLRV